MTQVAIQIPDELNQFVNRSVQNGAYHDAGEFMVSMLYSLKEQSEAPLTEEEKQKLLTLRSDVQHAADQLDRGEGIRAFNWEAFLAERHQAFAIKRPA